MATSKTSRNQENIKKMNLIQLKEVLQREDTLLKNKSILSKLPDRGESVRKFHEQVKNEIKYREDLSDLEHSISALKLSETDKHVQKICEMEKTPKKERYKPFSTLNNTKQVHTNRNVFKTMEDWSKCNKPTKLISLVESIEILKHQDEVIKEEQVKLKHRLLVRQLENEDSEKSDEENRDNSDVESESESEDKK
ncbi:uncharacterized protein LOC130446498 [Diorhabda sublineata]|uniref:uncharacterized protein LOC130446498 n=1 Tax=Diorhabda sublineata TaxID=1163346 RepID=UPI0024E16DFF|nr:uncharacterized protein LOC130446498 [Diorhabda sublineata]